MKPAAAKAARTVTSLHGRRVLVVPVLPCTPRGQDMPADHQCPAAAVRRSLRLAVATVYPSPGALKAIRTRICRTATLSERDSSMTDPTYPARHAMPALREMASDVRAKAEEAEAAELRHRVSAYAFTVLVAAGFFIALLVAVPLGRREGK